MEQDLHRQAPFGKRSQIERPTFETSAHATAREDPMKPFPGFNGPVWLRQRARLVQETQRSRAAAEAVAGELERILESITDGFCSLDRSYRYQYVNRQAEEILGRRRQELVGKSALEGSPMSEAGITAVRKAMEQGETCHAQAFNLPSQCPNVR